MRHQIAYCLLALAMAGVPAAATAQSAADSSKATAENFAQKHGRWGVRRDWIGYLLEHRADLKLTDAQVARLGEVQRRLQEQNRPLLARLDSLRASRAKGDGPSGGPTDEERRAWRAQRREARPAFRQLRANYRVAMRTVREVLTPEQRDRARELLAEERRARRGR